MRGETWQIGICGTFDVANYGDLLFPVIAEWELTERLGPLTLHRFSYDAKTPPDWPYAVTSVAALPSLVGRLDGLIVGGGFIVRFDKDVAPGYGPPPGIHHPTGYWLTPALIALQHDVPVVWNAPGMHCNDIPAWAVLLLERALTLSRYVSVRDEPSAMVLRLLSDAEVSVVPDSAFAIRRLLDAAAPRTAPLSWLGEVCPVVESHHFFSMEAPASECARLRQVCGFEGPYVVVQATLGLEDFMAFVRSSGPELGHLRFVALPVGPVLGERSDILDLGIPGVVSLPSWPAPMVIAELIAQSEAVVGHSYHLIITALACGVPVFTRQDLSIGKYSALRAQATIHALPDRGAPEIGWFLERVGRTAPTASVLATAGLVAGHWDRIAAAIKAEGPPTSPAMNAFWQQLPSLLEVAASRAVPAPPGEDT